MDETKSESIETLYQLYRNTYETLKQVLPFCETKLNSEKMLQLQESISYIDNNILQLNIHYENLNSTHVFPLNEHSNINSLCQTVETNYDLDCLTELNNCLTEIDMIDNGQYSEDYLFSIDNTDDLFELIQSSENIDQSDHQNLDLNSTSTDQQRYHQENKKRTNYNRKKMKKNNSITQGQSRIRSNEIRIWYRCAWDGCSFGSYYNGVVKRHSMKRHSGKIKIDKLSNSAMHRFRCDWPGCDVSLVAYHKLVEHKRKHTGEKPFQCKWNSCNYATARLYSMIIHERTHKLNHFTSK